MNYRAFVVTRSKDGEFKGSVETLSLEDLPAGDVLIKVACSSVNFKDALSFSGNKGVTKEFPHTPGIDAAGEVVSCSAGDFDKGQPVIVVGYDLGMNTSGGFGEYISVPKEWVMPMPVGMSAKQGMGWGTAGFTAALCLDKLIMAGVKPDQGPVLVSGASGGVGTIAIMLLAKLGYEVHALTAKTADRDFFKKLGASDVVDRVSFLDQAKRPLLKPVYAAAIDVAGGGVLATLLKVIKPSGSVACCGLVASVELNTTVLPFILRGVNLLGVDSVELPLQVKKDMWRKMADEWALPQLLEQCQIIQKEQLASTLQLLLDGSVKGRYVLSHT
jgi:acrylyl-CoA reductase (NADPH)